MKRASALVAIAGILVARAAAADPAGDARVAQALFEEGRALMEQKRFAEACPKLKESQRLDPGGGTLLNLASCHASEGKTATAIEEYREALMVAQRDGRKDREQIARTNISALEREVARITVVVPHPVPGLEVKLDTTTLASAAWGVATPADPGAHIVTATAPGSTPVTVRVEVKGGERKVVEVPRIEKPAAPAPTPTGPSAAEPKKHANPVFWAGFGVGMTAMGISAVTGVLTLTNALAAGDDCISERQYCASVRGRDALSNARAFGWISTVSFGVGCVGLLVALIAPSKKSVVVGGQTLGVRF